MPLCLVQALLETLLVIAIVFGLAIFLFAVNSALSELFNAYYSKSTEGG